MSMRSYHVSVPIDTALELLLEGKNIFNGTPQQAAKDLVQARNAGQRMYTGCDNVDAEGKCQGHAVL